VGGHENWFSIHSPKLYQGAQNLYLLCHRAIISGAHLIERGIYFTPGQQDGYSDLGAGTAVKGLCSLSGPAMPQGR